MESDRIFWIDNIKAIAIFLVLFGHYVDTPVVEAYVYSFHMEAFFFVSGLVYSHRYSFGRLAFNRFRTLLIPYFVFSGFNFFFIVLRESFGQSPGTGFTLTDKFIDIFLWHEFWFLGSLYVVTLAFYFIAPRVKSVLAFLFFAVASSFIHFVLSRYFSGYLHENLLKCFNAIVFYGLGYVLQYWLIRSGKANQFLLDYRIILAVLLVNVVIFHLCYTEYGMIQINFSENYLYFYVLALCGIFFVYLISNLIKYNKYIAFVGANTILIYLLEGYPPAIIKRVMYYLFQVDNFNYINPFYASLYSVSSILILVPCILIINRYFPYLIGKEVRQKSADAVVKI